MVLTTLRLAHVTLFIRPIIVLQHLDTPTNIALSSCLDEIHTETLTLPFFFPYADLARH